MCIATIATPVSFDWSTLKSQGIPHNNSTLVLSNKKQNKIKQNKIKIEQNKATFSRKGNA